MKRITPEMVKAAYAKTGLQPARYLYYSGPAGVACALCACAAEKGPPPDDEFLRWAIRVLDVTPVYASGFVRGFDGDGYWGTNESYKQGYADGRAVAAAIWGEG